LYPIRVQLCDGFLRGRTTARVSPLMCQTGNELQAPLDQVRDPEQSR
jgi:hypothetical protein